MEPEIPSKESLAILDAARTHEEALASLELIPEAEAARVLVEAMTLGCLGGFTLARAEVFQYQELIHRFFGCQSPNKKCDLDETTEMHPWEKIIRQDLEYIHKEAARYMVGNMFIWMRLANVVGQHEDLIRKRWLKKTHAQRKDLLLRAMPGMAAMHRPDIEDVLHTCCPYNRHPDGIAFHAFPYLNLEDMTKPKSLLMLLNTRGRNLPNVFAYSDFELGPLAQIRPMLLKETTFTMDFIESYGGIVEHSTGSEAASSINKGTTMHPVHGWHMLAVQRLLMKFLFQCCQEILHDLSLTSVMLAAESTFPPEPPQLSDNNDLYSSLDVAVREAPYQLPARLDLGRLQGLVSACRNSAEDHIWSLREDPGYFSEVVQEYREHRQELLKGEDGRPIHTPLKERPLMNKVLRTVITDAYVEFYVWDEVQRRIFQLHGMTLQYANEIQDTRKDLPEPFFEALVEAWFYLEATMLDLVHQIEYGWCASPSIRGFWAQDSAEKCIHCVQPKYMGRDTRDKDLELVFRLMDFLSYAQYRNTLGIHTIVDAIERLLQTNARAKALTSPWIASYLSQLSVATECFHQLELFQPWARKVKHCVEERKTKLFIRYAGTFSKWHKVLLTRFVGADLYELGKPGAKFYYPVHKRRTRAHVETMRSAEAALDAFWDAADNRFRQIAGKTPHDIVASIIEERTLQRTPPWVEPEKSAKASALHQPPEYIYVPISSTQHDPSKQITGAFNRLAIESSRKAKTHGLADFPSDPQEDIAPPAEVVDQQPTFHLDKRAHKVFKTMFHSPLSRDQPGEIPWADFLHAMVKTGFSAQKLQGSAWQFTPRDLDVEQPIQFHEPHPTAKLPYTWARRFGRRLSRTYGWTGDMFRLA